MSDTGSVAPAAASQGTVAATGYSSYHNLNTKTKPVKKKTALTEKVSKTTLTVMPSTQTITKSKNT